MARFIVLERPGDAEGAVIVRDAFSILGLLVPVIWLAWHRLWFAALAAFGLLVLAGLAARSLGFSAPLVAAELMAALYVALEGATMRVAALEARGYAIVNVVHADSMAEAEIRHFAGPRGLVAARGGNAVEGTLLPPYAGAPVSAFPVLSPRRG
jgi:Protein of unknown function (DUF2628)